MNSGLSDWRRRWDWKFFPESIAFQPGEFGSNTEIFWKASKAAPLWLPTQGGGEGAVEGNDCQAWWSGVEGDSHAQKRPGTPTDQGGALGSVSPGPLPRRFIQAASAS